MKAEFEVRKSVEEISPLEAIVGGKVQKKRHSSKKSRNSSVNSMDDKEKMEIKAYLNRLQEIVPFMPKDKKLSKVEVISYVIEYIRELRVTLGLPPCEADMDDMDVLLGQSASPAVMMSMALMTNSSRNSVPETVHSASVTTASVNTSISSARSSPASAGATVTSQQQSRQPLGIIVNPLNSTSSATLSSQILHKPAVYTSTGK